MKKLIKNLKGKGTLCSLCLAVASVVYTFYGSFLFLGEPEVPECMKGE
ncbi:cyclic lactone autoinducer peptide [Clostridium aciditolerans]|uniref:Cyclic lactone autoinducer peptide n=1 Tax=Clostridium aciditolerans TaxID=339861 RepID=A0A934HZI9_9CLOT|nr:cyclic lactone autoinducer peptide [Clostridium aciditolerans]MBI6873265.1 cyclic lactone autoinducer peptide [Clostridium aciditolerans]